MIKPKSLLCIAVVTLALAIHAHAQQFLTNGLIAHFLLDGNAVDATGLGHDGTVFGAQPGTDRNGNPNRAFALNGSSDRIVAPDTGFPSGNAPRTVSIWVRLTSFKDITYPMSYGTDGATDAFYLTANTLAPGGPGFTVGQSGGGDFPKWGPPVVGEWYHLVVTHDGATTTLYVNATNIASGARTYTTTLSGNFNIGAYVAGFPPTFDGWLDDVRVYDRALSAKEVRALNRIESGLQVELVKSVQPSFASLQVGTNYQLQVSGDAKGWTNHGSPFSATSELMIYPDYFRVDNWSQLFFRLQYVP